MRNERRGDDLPPAVLPPTTGEVGRSADHWSAIGTPETPSSARRYGWRGFRVGAQGNPSVTARSKDAPRQTQDPC